MSKLLLSQAEELFGERVNDWSYDHQVTIQDGPPHLIYNSSGEIYISLSTSAQDLEYKIVSQLSHEIAHVISPAKNPVVDYLQILVINEGVSEFFSLLALSTWFEIELNEVYESKKEPYPEYFDALNLVIDLHKGNRDIIKNLRKRKKYLNELTYEDIRLENGIVDDAKIHRLLSSFSFQQK